MRRILVFIAVLFSFASLAGASLANAHRFEVAEPLVVLNHVDEYNRSIPVVVKLQPYGNIDLGEGIVLPCGPHQAIPLSVPGLPVYRGEEGHEWLANASPRLTPCPPLLRPPRQA